MEYPSGDRRQHRRYPVDSQVEYKVVSGREVTEIGFGRVLNLSSGGILFDAGRPLPAGLNVELSITWPVMLHNVAPLQLLVYGKIVRSDGRRTAIRMMQHEFRTAGAMMERRLALANGTRSTQPLLSRVGGGPGVIEPR